MYTFSLDAEQITKLHEWMKDKPISKAAMGEQYTFEFTPTGLGLITNVHCGMTQTKIDLTDYENW